MTSPFLRWSLLAAALVVAGGCTPLRASTRATAAATEAPATAATFETLAAGGQPRAEDVAKLPPGFEPLARALAARRALDDAGELAALLEAVRAAPRHPLAVIALRRIGELSITAPALAEAARAGLAPVVEAEGASALGGLAAARARGTAALAAEVLGDLASAARLRRENGAVTAWTLTGPFSSYRALSFADPVPPERGLVPAEVAAPAGLPPFRTRTLPVPDGTFSLDGEPLGLDGYALVADAELSRGGEYLAVLSTELSVRLSVDGAVVAERRAFAGFAPGSVALPLALGPGRHRVVVKAARGAEGRSAIALYLARQDGAPSDARWTAPAGDGSVPFDAAPGAALPRRPVEPVLGARALVEALAPVTGPALARVLAARDVQRFDPETARALLGEAAQAAPGSALVRAARAGALPDAPGLDPRRASGLAEAELRAVIAADPGHAEARVALARLLLSQDRRGDADEVLAGLAGPAAARPAALVVRARVALARELDEPAEAAVAEALAGGATCEALEFGLELADRAGAVARADERAAGLARCLGRTSLAGHLRRRGEPAAARAVIEPLAAARPWDVALALLRADLLTAEGRPADAAGALAAVAALWPRSERVQKALGDARELAGDPAGARAAREAALLADPADLRLRRALALEDGHELLDDLAEDGAAALRRYRASPPAAGVSTALVLDAAAMEFHPGGAVTERIHELWHVLDQGGVETLGEVTVPAGAEILTLRTLKPDGRALAPDRTARGKGSISLAGLEPGDFVELEYLHPLRLPPEGGSPSLFWFQTIGERLLRSTFVARAPAAMGLAVEAGQMELPAIRREGGFDVVRVERTGMPDPAREEGAPPTSEWLPFVRTGVGGGLDALARRAADEVLLRARSTPELRALADEVRAAAGPGASPAALVRAAYARVQARLLGSGGSLRDEPGPALSRGRGTRLVVLRAVLEELGLAPRLALVRPFSADPAPRRFPDGGTAGGTWAAPMLRVEAGGETFWLDTSLRGLPFGAFNGLLADCDAILLPAAGEAPRLVRTPARPAVADSHAMQLRITLAADGSAALEGQLTWTGASAAELREAIEPVDERQRLAAFEHLLSRQFAGVTLTAIAVEHEGDPEAPLRLRFTGRAPGVARATPGGLVIDAPLFPAELGGGYVQVTRSLPLLVDRSPLTQRIEIVPPPGLRLAATAPRQVDGPFGRYTRTEHLEGGALVREERLEVQRARVPPERYQAFAAFAVAVGVIQQEPVRLTR